MKLIKTFEPFFQSLRDLPFWAQLAATELIITERDGVLSVCYVTDSLFDFIKLVGDVPQSIREADTERYGVDLESIGTNKVRLYTDGDSSRNEALHGYYVNNGAIYEKKRYKRNADGGLLIDRYDASGVIISADEPETSGDRSIWTGPSEIADAAEAMGGSWSVVYMEKGNAPQSYIRITK
jgi:hypothetical protein